MQYETHPVRAPNFFDIQELYRQQRFLTTFFMYRRSLSFPGFATVRGQDQPLACLQVGFYSITSRCVLPEQYSHFCGRSIPVAGTES